MSDGMKEMVTGASLAPMTQFPVGSFTSSPYPSWASSPERMKMKVVRFTSPSLADLSRQYYYISAKGNPDASLWQYTAPTDDGNGMYFFDVIGRDDDQWLRADGFQSKLMPNVSVTDVTPNSPPVAITVTASAPEGGLHPLIAEILAGKEVNSVIEAGAGDYSGWGKVALKHGLTSNSRQHDDSGVYAVRFDKPGAAFGFTAYRRGPSTIHGDTGPGFNKPEDLDNELTKRAELSAYKKKYKIENNLGEATKVDDNTTAGVLRRALRAGHSRDAVRHIATAMSAHFKAENPDFSDKKFMAASLRENNIEEATRVDHNATAGVLRRALMAGHSPDAIRHVATAMSAHFQAENPHFSDERFMAASLGHVGSSRPKSSMAKKYGLDTDSPAFKAAKTPAERMKALGGVKLSDVADLGGD